MKELDEYVHNRLAAEFALVSRQMSDKLVSVLTNEEKTLIYKYSNDGFYVNERLREGELKKIPFAEYLDFTLSKLPDYEGVVFRGAKLSQTEIARYKTASENDAVIFNPSFLSCTLKRSIARQFGTVIFEIYVKNGKLIETISKFGTDSNQNEREVLLRKSSKFLITGVEKEDNYTIITAEEI
jgi:hypothetical protein